MTNTQIEKFKSEDDLKVLIAKSYQKQIENYFGNEQRAMRFLSSVMAAVQRTPKLLECTPVSVINSFMTMAQLQFMPSEVSGEAYVQAYDNKKKEGGRYITVTEAQFQLGYQGLVTLFYRAGVKEVRAEIVYDNDQFEYMNGKVIHKPDIFSEDRGKAKGAYVIVVLDTGAEVVKVMSKKEILNIGERFSKSFKSEYSPWNPKNDPQLWMWKKTVLKQTAKLVPKNDEIVTAVAEDNKDSVIGDPKVDNLLPAVDLESYTAKLEAAESVDELSKQWADMPVEAKESLEAKKNELKAKLSGSSEPEPPTDEPQAPTEPAPEPPKAEELPKNTFKELTDMAKEAGMDGDQFNHWINTLYKVDLINLPDVVVPNVKKALTQRITANKNKSMSQEDAAKALGANA